MPTQAELKLLREKIRRHNERARALRSDSPDGPGQHGYDFADLYGTSKSRMRRQVAQDGCITLDGVEYVPRSDSPDPDVRLTEQKGACNTPFGQLIVDDFSVVLNGVRYVSHSSTHGYVARWMNLDLDGHPIGGFLDAPGAGLTKVLVAASIEVEVGHPKGGGV